MSESTPASSTLSAYDSQGQLPLINGFDDRKSKGKKQGCGRSTWVTLSPALTESAFRHARTAAASVSAEKRLSVARGFTFCVLAAYWENLRARKNQSLGAPLPSLPPGVETATLTEAAREAARAIGTAVSGLNEMDASYLIGGLYTAAMPERVRAQLGAYYTPPALCERLLDMATEAGVDWRSARVLDPACGGGAFLSAVARRMLQRMAGGDSKMDSKNVRRRLVGFEVDPFAAWMSRVFLDITLGGVGASSGMKLGSVVQVCDALTQPSDKHGFDLVVGNPPYGRIPLPSEVREAYGRSLFGHANLYGLFTDLALRYARPGAVIAYVTPTSFLSGMYFKSLRELLGRLAPPVNIGFVNARKGVFAGVLQETLLATYRRENRSQVARVDFIHPNSDGSIETTAAGSFRLPERLDRPWLIPRTPGHTELIRRAAALPYRLRDYGYKVSTGPLVWNRHKGSLRNAAGRKRHPVIWAESVRPAGTFEFRAEKRNHQPYFEPKPEEAWLVTDFPCVLLQRTTAKEQKRRLIAAELPASFIAEHGEVVIENHLNMIKPIQGTPLVSPAAVAGLLNSLVVDQLFRCFSGSVAVSAYELEALPLPSPSAMKEIEDLVGRGVSPPGLDEAVQRLYETGST